MRKQRIKPKLVNVLGSKFDISGIEHDNNVEGLRTRAAKSKQIRAYRFQSQLLWAHTEFFAAFFTLLASMVAEKIIFKHTIEHAIFCSFFHALSFNGCWENNIWVHNLESSWDLLGKRCQDLAAWIGLQLAQPIVPLQGITVIWNLKHEKDFGQPSQRNRRVSWRRHRLRFKSVCQLVFFKGCNEYNVTYNDYKWKTMSTISFKAL